MKNFSALKVLEKLILPFVLLASARYLGVFLTSYLAPVNLRFGDQNLPTLPLLDLGQSSQLINSISWFLLALLAATYFGFVIFRSFYLHEDSLHPHEAARLHSTGKEFLIFKAHEALHQNMSWLLLTGFSVFLASIDYFSGQLSSFVFMWLVTQSFILILASWKFLTEESLERA